MPSGRARPLRTTRASRAAMALDVIVGLSPERFAQHPPRALARDLIQQQNLLTRFPRILLLLDYFRYRWRLLPIRLPPGFALLTRKGTPPFSCALQIHNFR